MTRDVVLAHARDYVQRHGWSVFLLAVDGRGGKVPPRNCARCNTLSTRYEPHDKSTCGCLLCHGFHAATRDLACVEAMLDALPGGYLAVSTGRVSGILVLDAEADDDDAVGHSGLDVLDDIESWTRAPNDDRTRDAWRLPRNTLTARTVSGGAHVYLRLPAGAPQIKSGRVLPNVDVKAESAYVGVPCGHDGRSWIDPAANVAEAPWELVRWLANQRRRRVGGDGGSRGGGTTVGYDYRRFKEEGCPDGHRDVFTNDVLFRLRRRGIDRDEAEKIARYHWRRYAQPGGGPGGVARHEMPWKHVRYKLERVWREVEPEKPLDATLTHWAANVDADAKATRRVGRVTIASGGAVESWGDRI